MTNSPTPPEDIDPEALEAEAEAQRPVMEDATVDDKIAQSLGIKIDSPIQPVRLTETDTFNFRCHKDVPCWNMCCRNIDLTLTPYDILRLSKRLDLRPAEFLLQYTVPALHDKSDLPVAKMKTTGEDGKGPCPFNQPEGCTVYEDRPAACRYYPLGMVSVKMKDMEGKDDFYFLVKEEHCQGHKESKTQTVGEFRGEQGAFPFERVNRGWIDILMKMASWKVLGGPMGKEPSAQTKKMFFMATTDVDSFRRFVFESKFLQTYHVDDTAQEIIKDDDEALLALAFDWLKNVLFNEATITLKEDVMQQAIARAREELAGGG